MYKCDPSDSSVDPYWIYHSPALGARDNGEYIRIVVYTIKETSYNDKGSFIGDVYSTDTSTYPSDSISINYWYTANGYDSTYSQGVKVGTVNDKTETTYPNNARHTDSFWYVKTHIDKIDKKKYRAVNLALYFYFVSAIRCLICCSTDSCFTLPTRAS